MWLILSLISFAFYASSDLLAAKEIKIGIDKYTPIKVKIISLLLGCLMSTILYFCGFSESGLFPWQIILQNPLILVVVLSGVVSNLFYLFGLYFVGLTVNESISGFANLFLFIEFIIFYLGIGKFDEIIEMSNPIKYLMLLFATVGIIILPQINSKEKIKEKTKSKVIIGIILSLIGTFFDSLDSFFTTVVFETSEIGLFDMSFALYLCGFFIATGLIIFLKIKNKTIFYENKKINKNVLLSGFFIAISAVIGISAYYFNGLMASFINVIYPILPMIGAKIFLKEKYSLKQYICIYTILVSSILFSIIDYL